MKIKALVTFLISLAVCFANAHEFWLQPKKYRYKVGEEMKVDFMVGENFMGEYWDLTRHKVDKLEMHSGSYIKNLYTLIKTSAGKNLSYKFDREGTHLLALQSDTALIKLDGQKFNAYLKEDGLDGILAARTKAGQLDKPAKESYKRFAKLLVQCESRTDDTFSKRMGFPYEIIPLLNPYNLQSGDYLTCRLLWQGKPLPHALAKVWSHIGNRTFLQNIYSEDDGTIKFPISSSGPWMVSSVKMIPSEKAGADYESMWASLVFGIESFQK